MKLASIFARVATTIALTVAVFGGASCGSDDEVPSRPSGGGTQSFDAGPDGLSGGTGGSGIIATGGTGATVATGGTGATDGAADSGACVPHEGAPLIDPATFDPCTLCDGAHCVPTSLVPSPEQAAQLANCDADRKCVPDHFIETLGNFILPTCRSINDSEGRCLSLCIPQAQQQADRLQQATCATGEVCAPCYDPVTEELTGACNVSCDPGPQEAPKTFPRCCNDIGACVPLALIPDDQEAMLGSDTCTDAGTLCVPAELSDKSFHPPTCRSIANAEGRCLPSCLPDVAAQADRLPQANCEAEHLCAPCYDPISGAATGACSINGDVPAEGAVTFTDCCGGIGSCIPTSLIPDNQESMLSAETCTTSGDLCVPDELSDTSFKPPTCTSLLNAEGRCLPRCLPDIAPQADRLPDCSATHECAPCFDPITGLSTGACTINGDAPANPTPVTFPDCCGTIGSCVPTTLIPDEQEGMLGTDVCTDAGSLCVPNELSDSSFVPPRCDSVGGFEGRCLPRCLPDIAVQADRLPDCSATHECAPCFDPLTGVATGACTINGDTPQGDPGTFDPCCGDIGRCVPTTLVPDEQESMLGTDTCTAQDVLCVPTELSDTSFIPQTCRSINDAEGRCLPRCLPDIAAQADRLPDCSTTHECAPCYDPITAEPTGACSVNGDAPAEDPKTFDKCCGDIGSCIPTSIIPDAQEPMLGLDVCTASDVLCVPNELADPTATPASCRSLNDSEGRCLPRCLPDIAVQADRLPDCSATHECAPCYDPLTSEATGACTVNGDSPTEDPKPFESCCSGIGACVPTSLVPADQQSMLGTDTCTGTGVLCAPRELADTTFIPPSCASIGGFEGRCLPRCIPDIAAQADRLPDCSATHECAPCYDPVSGAPTGACTINGDTPQNAPQVFQKCCNQNGTTHGTCVPTSALTSSQVSSLPQETCPDANWRCVPDLKANDPTALFPTCQLPIASFACSPPIINLGCPGACMTSCFISSSQAGFLTQGTCTTGELCAPCVDPLSGARTGACD